MERQKDIRDALTELLTARGITPAKLAQTTDIPNRFISSLLKGDFDQLPSKPYVRGYLFKIAEVLEVDPHTLWQSYRDSADLFSAGEHDRLPANRFALKQIKRSVLVGVIMFVLFVGFLGFRFNDILGKPTLDLTLPETTQEEVITITGAVRPGDRVTLNNEALFPDEGGAFKKEVQLEPGLNTLNFVVTRYLGRETRVVQQVFYEPPPVAVPEPQPETPEVIEE